MTNPTAFYEENIREYTRQVEKAQMQWLRVSTLRLLCFAALCVAVYYWIKSGDAQWPLITILCAAIFLWLVKIAFRLRDKKALLEKLLFVNTNEIAIAQQQPNGLGDGLQFEKGESYTSDLDIFGKGSLYQLLNRTTTAHGSAQLAALLQEPLLKTDAIENQQQAVKVLSEQKELRQLITANGLLHSEKEGNLHDINSWLTMPSLLLHRKWLAVVRWLIPLYNLAALIYYIFTNDYKLLTLGALASWVIIGCFVKRINMQHLLLGKKQAILQQYATILRLFSGADTGGSQLLQQEQSRATSAHLTIRKLSSLAGIFDQRLNMLVILFLNSFVMYDIQCMWALEKWRTGNKEKFPEWIKCVGTIETLVSLATYAFNSPAYVYPVIKPSPLAVKATALAHPLIPATVRVANDVDMGHAEQLVLVTGSNMSGKTTFLRAIGVNVVLAQCGVPVCAEQFAFSPMRIFTSIRVSDSLQEQTSYFMAELKQLQFIIRNVQNGEPALVLIDEILRGTNSDDKTHGSEQFIRKLLQYNCLTLFATHDLALSVLEEELPGRISNYCFESTIRNNELLFDYTLQRGVAKNKNASFLMQKMEII
ncbi:MAG: hypothetical protein QM731_05710 [Chitinophagaceae bacterium]